jgi:hypothetical protein
MSNNFDNYDEIYVNIDRVRKNKSDKSIKSDMNNNENKNKILINRERDSRYARKNRRIVNNYWKIFNNSQSIPTQADWNWDLSFDWDLGSGWASNYQDNSSIQGSPGSPASPASPALTYCSSSSYLKSFDDISWIEV